MAQEYGLYDPSHRRPNTQKSSKMFIISPHQRTTANNKKEPFFFLYFIFICFLTKTYEAAKKTQNRKEGHRINKRDRSENWWKGKKKMSTCWTWWGDGVRIEEFLGVRREEKGTKIWRWKPRSGATHLFEIETRYEGFLAVCRGPLNYNCECKASSSTTLSLHLRKKRVLEMLAYHINK